MKRMICRIFGHSVNEIELALAEIKIWSTNENQVEIVCKRCKKVLEKRNES